MKPVLLKILYLKKIFQNLERKHLILRKIKPLYIFGAFLFFISLVIFYLDIGFKDFYVQYILYPPSIGEGRLGNFKITFTGFFNHYKFIIIPLLFIILFKIKNFKKDIFQNLLILSFVVCLIFHQIFLRGFSCLTFTIDSQPMRL